MAIHFAFLLPPAPSARRPILFLFLATFASFPFLKASQEFGNGQFCGTLFAAPNSQGETFPFHDQDQSSNLQDDQRVLAAGWGTTGTVVVEDGCTFSVCNDTYLFGSCQSLKHGSYSLKDNPILGNIASAQCTCPKQCQCSDIHVRKTSCGRAYLEEGCRTCSALYTDLSVGSNLFPEEFKNKVTSLRLRRGCTLKIYEDDEFEGEEKVIDRDIVEDYQDVIGSYQCDCDDTAFVPRVRKPPPKSYPEMINIPNSMDEVLQMLETDAYRDHPGLHAARRSYVNGRSSKNSYMLVIGSTGSGKSSAINLLFDRNVTSEGDYISITSHIHEFRIPVPIEELGIANSELRVIDTPGLGDTRGLEHDAKYLATLDNYLSTHEELKDRIPNVVLILHKFDDNRFDGEGSAFVKMVRGFDSFSKRITDKKYSNVIFVLSHFCSVRKDIRRKPGARLRKFRDVIKDYTLYPPPFHLTVAENKAYEQYLPMVKGFYKLPNGEYYPKNLFEKLELVTGKGGDPIGLGVFRSAFRDSENFNVSFSRYNLMGPTGDKVEKYLNVLSNANIGVVNTPVSQHLQIVWESMKPDLRRRYPHSAAYLQKALNLRNINTMQDVPRTVTDTLTLLTALTHDEATRTLLEQGLNLTSPDFPGKTVAGYGYNVFKDMPLPMSPFKIGNLDHSDIGFKIPTSLSCTPDPGTEQHFYIFQNKKEYLAERLKSLGVEGAISADMFTNDVRPGSNILETSFRDNGCSLSATKDFRVFEFILNDKLDLTPEFQKVVKGLPPIDLEDPASVAKWRHFFDTYGTHVVQRIYGGGSIQITLETRKPFNSEFSEAVFDLLKFAEDLTYDMNEGSNRTASNKAVLGEGTTQTITFSGGSPEFYFNDLSQMSMTQASRLIQNWKNSLKFHPAMLTTKMRLVPLSHIVKRKRMDQKYVEEMDKATLLLFDSALTYKPPPPTSTKGPGHGRDDTPIVEEVMRLIKESNDRMYNLTLELKKQEQVLHNQTLALQKERLEWEKESKQLDLKWKKFLVEAESMKEEERRKHEAALAAERRAHEENMGELRKQEAEAKRKEAEDAHKRQMEMQKLINEGKTGCLKAGTKILMAGGSEKEVETLKVGDVILDKYLRPTTVLGVTQEFLLNQSFYGFEEGSAFFTGNHLFVGPSSSPEAGKDMKLYALATDGLYLENPLSAYLNVTEMGMRPEDTVLYHLDRSSDERRMSTVPITEIFTDPHQYPEDTLMYIIKVDSPTGTYIANGYVCRHEIPPLERWPNTMGLLFQLMDIPALKKLPLIPYTVENVDKIGRSLEEIARAVEEYLAHRFASVSSWEKNGGALSASPIHPRMTLEGVNIEERIPQIFGHSTFSKAIVGFYAKVGLVMSRYLDNGNGAFIEGIGEEHMGTLQHNLFSFICAEVDKHLSRL